MGYLASVVGFFTYSGLLLETAFNFQSIVDYFESTLGYFRVRWPVILGYWALLGESRLNVKERHARPAQEGRPGPE